MRELSFETGLVTYALNGSVQVTFNPTDSAFVERLFNTFDSLDKKQEAYKAEVDQTADSRAVFDVARKWDGEMRTMIDDVFQQPVCDTLFGSMNVYAMASGLPAWVNLLLTIMEEIDTTFAREQKATNPRLQKYMEKYKGRK